MYNNTHTTLNRPAFASGRRGTGFAGPLAAPPARGEAATRSESAAGVCNMARALHAAGFRAGQLVHNCFSYHFVPAGTMMSPLATLMRT